MTVKWILRVRELILPFGAMVSTSFGFATLVAIVLRAHLGAHPTDDALKAFFWGLISAVVVGLLAFAIAWVFHWWFCQKYSPSKDVIEWVELTGSAADYPDGLTSTSAAICTANRILPDFARMTNAAMDVLELVRKERDRYKKSDPGNSGRPDPEWVILNQTFETLVACVEDVNQRYFRRWKLFAEEKHLILGGSPKTFREKLRLPR